MKAIKIHQSPEYLGEFHPWVRREVVPICFEAKEDRPHILNGLRHLEVGIVARCLDEVFKFEFLVKPFLGLMSPSEERILLYVHCGFPDAYELGIDPMALMSEFALDIEIYTTAPTRFNIAPRRQFVAVKQLEALSPRKNDASSLF